MTDEVSITYQCWDCGKEFETLLGMEQHLHTKNHGTFYILKQFVNGNLAGEQVGSTAQMRMAHEIEMAESA